MSASQRVSVSPLSPVQVSRPRSRPPSPGLSLQHVSFSAFQRFCFFRVCPLPNSCFPILLFPSSPFSFQRFSVSAFASDHFQLSPRTDFSFSVFQRVSFCPLISAFCFPNFCFSPERFSFSRKLHQRSPRKSVVAPDQTTVLTLSRDVRWSAKWPQCSGMPPQCSHAFAHRSGQPYASHRGAHPRKGLVNWSMQGPQRVQPRRYPAK